MAAPILGVAQDRHDAGRLRVLLLLPTVLPPPPPPPLTFETNTTNTAQYLGETILA